MLYVVRRSSEWTEKPCDGAIKVECLRADRRTFLSPEEHDSRFPARPWESFGINHGVWDNGKEKGIVRYIPDKAWVMNIDDLHDFVRQHGSIVLEENDENDASTFSVEIYDGYRE